MQKNMFYVWWIEFIRYRRVDSVLAYRWRKRMKPNSNWNRKRCEKIHMHTPLYDNCNWIARPANIVTIIKRTENCECVSRCRHRTGSKSIRFGVRHGESVNVCCSIYTFLFSLLSSVCVWRLNCWILHDPIDLSVQVCGLSTGLWYYIEFAITNSCIIA